MAEDGNNPCVTPLSNDPESLTAFAETIGLNPACFQFAEIFSFDPELLALIPRPIYTIIFLFPINKEGGFIESRHTTPVELQPPIPWFTFQTLGNACGSIAVIHSIMNNLDRLSIREGSWLSRFVSAFGPDTTPAQRANFIEHNTNLVDLHEQNALQDTTPLNKDSQWNHFVTFLLLGGALWELDGRKPQPINHGPCQDVLNGALDIVRRDFHPNVPNIMETSMAAFCGISDE
jgi:hypothetical protein